MKKLFILSLLCCVFIYSTQAQSIKKEKVNFQYTKLPLKPLDGLTSYSFKVSTPYPENSDDIVRLAKEKYENDLANYDSVVKDAEIKHEEALQSYEQDVEIARENFKLESEEFKQLSLVERLALADKKPRLRLPPKPVYRKPAEPYYREPNLSNTIVYNPDVLSNTYLNVQGLEKKEEAQNCLQGEITLYDFEYLEPERKSREESYYDTQAKATKKKYVYYYLTSSKRPTNVKLTYNGEVIYDDLFHTTKDFTSLETSSRPSKFNLEKKSVQEVLEQINSYINNNHAFTKASVGTNIRYVKNKKGEYDDIESAYNYAKSGYANFTTEDNNDLEEAIDIWEKVLTESDVEDKKARINKKVTRAVLLNLVEAYTYINDMENALSKVEDLEKIDLKYYDKEFLKSFKLFMNDKKERLNANEML